MPVISTNTAANSAIRYLNQNSEMQSSSISKLASGSRITKASDDAAGLAIGSRLTSDITALNQAATNASHGSSILQAADGGMARIGDILQRMKALATQSLSGAVTNTERGYINAEYQQLIGEIDGIATGTRFNGASLLDGTFTASFLVGTNAADDTIAVTVADVRGAALTVAPSTVDNAANATTAMPLIDAAINTISNQRASVGAQMSRFDYRGQAIETSLENLAAANSAIMDVDVAEEQSKLSAAEVMTQASIAALSRANQMPQHLLSLMR